MTRRRPLGYFNHAQRAIPGGGQHAPWDCVLLNLYDTEFQRLVTLARRYLDSEAIAEEVVQESFVRYHTAANRPAAGRELSYLQSIVLNQARSALRRVRTARNAPIEVPLVAPSSESVYLNQHATESLAQLLSTLPARQRQVLTCRHLVGLSESETATALAISVGAVKQHASRGRAALAHTAAA